MTTKNVEKEFRIELIASLLENRLLNCENSEYIVTENDLYDLCSFVSNFNVDKLNFFTLGNKVKNIILKLNPELNIRINQNDSELYDTDIDSILKIYKKLYGDTYKIKSVKKCIIKSLEIQS